MAKARVAQAACAINLKLSMNEHVFLLKGRILAWLFLSHVSASVKLGFSSIFVFDFLAENWDNSPILQLRKGLIIVQISA